MKKLTTVFLFSALVSCNTTYQKEINNDLDVRSIDGVQYTGFWWKIIKNPGSLVNSTSVIKRDYKIFPTSYSKDSMMVEVNKYMDALIREDKRFDSISNSLK